MAWWPCSSPASDCTFAAHKGCLAALRGCCAEGPSAIMPRELPEHHWALLALGFIAAGLKWSRVGWVPTRALPLSLKEGMQVHGDS